MSILRLILGGVTGATALTAIHQAGKVTLAHPPRADVLGRRVITRPMRAMGMHPPVGNRLQGAALAVDLISNSLWYSLIGFSSPRRLWRNAGLLGLAAGFSAILLPPVLGLGSKPTSRTYQTMGLTIGYYFFGAIAAAGAMCLMGKNEPRGVDIAR